MHLRWYLCPLLVMKNEEFNMLISLFPFPDFLGFVSTAVEVLPVDLHLIPPIKWHCSCRSKTYQCTQLVYISCTCFHGII